MKKAFKWIIGTLLVLTIVVIGLFQYLRYQTKQASPETEVHYIENEFDIEVVYSAPAKRERIIFGNVVKYNEVWRTGANEPTTFTTKSDLAINGNELKAGKYTLWTIPNELEWTVIWNSGEYGWGINFDGKATRNPDLDVLSIQVPVIRHEFPRTEIFTIAINGYPPMMSMDWDDVSIRFPIEPLSPIEQ